MILAQRLAIGVPAVLLGGAYISEYGFGLYPCEMCWWQRWPHFAAIALGLVATFLPRPRIWLALSALAIMISGALGLFHAGVEYGWWTGITDCALVATDAADAMDAILNAPLTRCDQAPWTLLGVSLAGWNFLISTLTGAAIFGLIFRKESA